MAPIVPRPSQPCFLFMCTDAPGAAELRMRDLEGHLAHVEANWQRYIIAGPTRAPGEDGLNGSLFLVYADSIEDAWAMMRKDPYFSNGQYDVVEARHFSPSIGLAIGGKTWSDAQSVRDRGASSPPNRAARERL